MFFLFISQTFTCLWKNSETRGSVVYLVPLMIKTGSPQASKQQDVVGMLFFIYIGRISRERWGIVGSSVIVTTDFTVAGHSIPTSFRQARDRLLGRDYLQSSVSWREQGVDQLAGKQGVCQDFVVRLFSSFSNLCMAGQEFLSCWVHAFSVLQHQVLIRAEFFLSTFKLFSNQFPSFPSNSFFNLQRKDQRQLFSLIMLKRRENDTEF